MKILSDEERNAHWNTVLYEGAKGTLIGLGVSYGLVSYLKKKHPIRYGQFNTSIKACLWSMPPVALGAFYADDGSVKFDEKQHRSVYFKEKEREQLERWDKLSWNDKAFVKVNDNKYKIIIGSWAASLYGSWKLVNRDKYMTGAQKAVQARVYAQAITVVLLLGTILLSMHEKELQKNAPAEIPEWQRVLDEQASKNKSITPSK
ncbi:Piso0_001603 [Millerozyma farinosa CBS 7064]|uniref:Piso0_001603 protein n=1 Tax=Pichia sorbitophila (strain ATCC MYA-4447 / BCRC 22081 / CBS 7064 / NBRC 10061 / NRRL Y-12695) TaxID=559304 RepID=G8YNL3_PICSO|nr:Piso0_001603 [Millerozyma farinosa CBS 7064]